MFKDDHGIIEYYSMMRDASFRAKNNSATTTINVM